VPLPSVNSPSVNANTKFRLTCSQRCHRTIWPSHNYRHLSFLAVPINVGNPFGTDHHVTCRDHPGGGGMVIELYRLQNCTAFGGPFMRKICANTDSSCGKLDTASFPRGCSRHALNYPHSLQCISWCVCIQNFVHLTAMFHWKYPTATKHNIYSYFMWIPHFFFNIP